MADEVKHEIRLDPDAVFEAHMAYGDVYDGPGSEMVAMEAAIRAYMLSYLEDHPHLAHQM